MDGNGWGAAGATPQVCPTTNSSPTPPPLELHSQSFLQSSSCVCWGKAEQLGANTHILVSSHSLTTGDLGDLQGFPFWILIFPGVMNLSDFCGLGL